MLERLRIRHLAIVEDAELAFAPGLNVVTGETGAGKSLLVDSVDLIVGSRADATRVREGEELAVVEAEFHLDRDVAEGVRALLRDWGIALEGETLIVRREVSAAGRSRALVNQGAVTLSSLRILGERLADLHGQHEHQSLLRSDAGREVLDRLGSTDAECSAYATARAAWLAARAALDELDARRVTWTEQRQAWIEAAHAIDAVHPSPGEDEALRLEATRLAHADRLRVRVAEALERLADGERPAVDLLGEAAHAIDQAAALDPALEEIAPALDEARIAAADAARALAEYASRLEVDPGTLEAIETRREAITRLVRTYGRDPSALITWREELRAELEGSVDFEAAHAEAREALEGARAGAARAARALSASRRAAARDWSARITRELKPLGLPHARLEFAIAKTQSEDAFPAHGLDEIEIRFTANAGEAPERLQKVASGGELSRVMLALKCALEAQDRVDVLVFDEVDSGIGGTVAQAVGERLRRLARHRQVVCVTHLPMIAALADRHLQVQKRFAAGRTHVRVERLEGSGRVEELARMLAGERVTETTRRQARELLRPDPAVR